MENSRRDFIKTAALVGLGGLVSIPTLHAESKQIVIEPANGKFSLPALGYEYNTLEPFIDAKTMEIHHLKHHQAYVNMLNEACELEKSIRDRPLDDVLKNLKYVTEPNKMLVRNAGGGHYNHSFFWKLLKKSTKPGPKATRLINTNFGSVENLKEQFEKSALGVFGSGWTWVVLFMGNLTIVNTPNQDNPIMDLSDKKGRPIIALDVWEHAYYLKYQNKRVEYIQAFWNVLNWDQVEANLG